MLYYLTSLHVSYVFTDSEPVDPYMVDGQNVPTEEQMTDYERVASQWNRNEYNCRNYILNALDDYMYDIYSTFATAREIWESLEKRYKTQVACSKKFVVGKFLNFKMNDAKPVVKQVEELQIIIHEMEVKGMGINSNFLVGSIIEKLPQSWKNFKLYLKHLIDDMSFEQLVLKIRIEEDNRMNEKADANSIETNANMVVESSSKSKSNHKNKGKNGGFGQKHSKDGKKDYTQQKNNNFKKVYHCWVCGKPGHKAKDCRHKKEHGGGNFGGNSNQANHVQSPKEFVGVTESFLTTNFVDWWYDTGCTKYICNSRRMFVSYQKVNELEPMFMGNGTSSKIEGKGKVILKLTSGKDLVLSNVLHVPNITKNLISGPILSNKGFKLVIESDKLVITKGGVYVGKGYLDEGLFKLSVVTDDNVINNNNAGTSTASVYMIDPSFLWHSRLGHVNFRSLQRMINLGMLPKCSKDKISKCEICVESKYTSHSHKSVEKSNEILGLIHTDLCDFKATPSRGGKNYYITFIDDCSKFCYVYLINTKDEALNMFKTYKAEVENQLDKKIKILRSDRGGEYESNDFAEFCSTFGIVHQTTAPYTPQQNGVAERKNRTLKNMINSMLITSGAPHSLWGEACLAANTILNKIPHKKSDKSPYQLWKGKQPSYKRMKVWGCLAKVQIPLPKRTKLGPKTVDCVYLGPAKNSAAYRFLVYKSNIEDISNNTIIESAEADFFENIFPYKDKEKQISNPRKRVMNDQLSQDETDNNSEIPQENVEPRRSKRAKVTKDFGPDYMTYIVNEEPQTYKAAMESSEAPYWKEAIQSEIDSIVHNNTWKLVDLPSGHKPIGHKWIFKKKLRPDGTIEKYKARLVAKGYRQKEGQDFFDTYSPVTRITSIRTLIAIAAIHNLIIHQMDVKTAFLNGELDEEIYMQQPEGFVVKGQEHKVCKLVKSLYGLKQAPKQWHEKFDNTLLSNGFQINECDKCVYVKQYKNAFVIICLYVDDMLIMGTNMDVINQTKKMLHSSFDMKDMGEADVILGIRIQKNSNGYILTQSHYIEKTLKKFGHYDDRPVVTPFDPKVQLKKNKGQSVSQLHYTQVLGSLMYIMNCTRPDLAYSVSRLSRYSHNPGRDHWDALVRVLQYLKHTMAYGLHYTKYPPVLEGYCDANWISNHNEGKSTSGYVFTLGGAAVSWKSSKQTVNTRSTMEAEFVALDKAAEEAEWLRSFLEGIPLWPKPVTAVCIHCDSMAALTRAKNHIYKKFKTYKTSPQYDEMDLVKKRNHFQRLQYLNSQSKIL
ncbi:retrovirus-related pol polyprotein from transposon TNT 1-94 [Tanacetum coccineum]|uniref:Retrovirus-related pol polyprotein from transposon TNT 1-94 n=1 Tax=Tanacetum coccineum TaxID=301880 RepID=A0ABQ4WXL8_9ASTR